MGTSCQKISKTGIAVLSTVFTTNIDNLIYRIFENSRKYYINDVDRSGPSFRDSNAIDYVPLHGSVMKTERPLRFSTTDVASSFGADADRWYYFQRKTEQLPTIIWGSSLADAPVLEAIIPATSRVGAPNDVWILIYPSSDLEAYIDYYKALNFKFISGTTEELLSYIDQNVSKPSVLGTSTKNTSELFPEFCIPIPSAVVNRPIADFFQGGAPMWSDIFSGNVYRTSFFETVREHVLSNKNVVITGIPGSGKTTLLMQLAAHLSLDVHKLIFSELSKEQAGLIVKKLDGEKAVVFIDNFTNDADVLRVFLETDNVRFVAADRDYFLSAITHLLPRISCEIINITDLSDEDIQGCLLSIPQPIRKPKPKIDSERNAKTSLFEFVQNNIVEPTLRSRFDKALRELRKSSGQLAEMLLFVSYVHSCRVPVSMDMAIAYWRGSITDYTEIWELVKNAGALLTEYEGDLAAEQQDYFSARSAIAAEAILEAATKQSYSAMLLKFHKNISPYRINHYDIFKRHGYDHKIIGDIFNTWEDGVHFYEMVYAKDNNPYILQHEALFLSSRGRHKDAFSVIDRAVSESFSTNWTIKNSHAIILFRANIDLAAEDSGAKKILNQSMEILKKCYISDRRKAFHAVTFADQTLKYANVYGDLDAKEYLEYAHLWLIEQKKVEPWYRDIPRYIKLIERHL